MDYDDELPPLSELIPAIDGSAFEWHHQLFLSIPFQERRHLEPGDLVRVGVRVYELLEATTVPEVGFCFLVRKFSTSLSYDELRRLTNGG